MIYQVEPRPQFNAEYNGHSYTAHVMQDRGTNTSEKYYTVSYKDAAGKTVVRHRSQYTHVAVKAAQKKLRNYAAELVSSPAQSVSDADMAAAVAAPVAVVEAPAKLDGMMQQYETATLRISPKEAKGYPVFVPTGIDISGPGVVRYPRNKPNATRILWHVSGDALARLKAQHTHFQIGGAVTPVAPPTEPAPVAEPATDEAVAPYQSFDLEPLQAAHKYEHDGDTTHCIICGRKLGKDAKMVHLSWYTGKLMNTANGEHPHSQGFFGIGSECAKKVPTGFVFGFDMETPIETAPVPTAATKTASVEDVTQRTGYIAHHGSTVLCTSAGQQMDETAGRYAISCDAHDVCGYAHTIHSGRIQMRHPELFCDECREAKKQDSK